MAGIEIGSRAGQFNVRANRVAAGSAKAAAGADLPKASSGAPRGGAKSENGGAGGGRAPDLAAGKSVAEIFGEIVWLMTQDASAKQMPLAELEWLVMPPILLRQFRVFYAPAPKGGAAGDTKAEMRPIGAVLFAIVSDAVAAALDADKEGKLRLTPQDWRSGPHKRAIRTIAPFGGAEEMMAQFLGNDAERWNGGV